MAWNQTADLEENDLSDFDATNTSGTGTIAASTASARSGTYGISVSVSAALDQAYGQFNGPTTEPAISIEGWIDPNGLTMATSDSFMFMQVRSASALILRGEIEYNGTSYRIRALCRNDASVDTTTSYYAITDAYHHVRIVWQAATSAGANDGWCALYLDGVFQEVITGLDTDTLSAETVRFGAIGLVDAGTSGTFYMDDMQWSSEYYLYSSEILSSIDSVPSFTPAYSVTPTIAAEDTAWSATTVLMPPTFWVAQGSRNMVAVQPDTAYLAEPDVGLVAVQPDKAYIAPPQVKAVAQDNQE